MKFIMLTSSNRYFWVISLIWAAYHVSGALSVETKANLPGDLLDTLRKANASEIREILNNSRRIIHGTEATENRPYMVYLKLPTSNAKFSEYRRWLCGGVIIHEEYILTSAACIEDVKHFYVVSGTFKFSFKDDRYNNPCIKNSAKKAVWKCVPKNYVFDGHENDNIRWMNNDIAVVKLEDEFDFTRRVRGCDFIPRPICYNNQSHGLEDPGTKCTIAGWGSVRTYNDWVNGRRGLASRRSDVDAQDLLEAPATILDKKPCKKVWGHRYDNIIDNYMICTEDMTAGLSEICQEKYVECTDILTSEEDNGDDRRRSNPNDIEVHSSNHNLSLTRRAVKSHGGGFCENDHGGPLVYGEGVSSVVIGIISACLVKEKTNKCYGPFLYTSVYKNRVLINCAINKNVGQDCNKLFRASDTHTTVEMSWTNHADGPAKNEIKAMRRKEEEKKLLAAKKENSTVVSTKTVTNQSTKKTTIKEEEPDSPLQHAGVVLRTRNDDDERREVIIDTLKHGADSNKTAT